MSDSYHGRNTVLLQTHFILEKTQTSFQPKEPDNGQMIDGLMRDEPMSEATQKLTEEQQLTDDFLVAVRQRDFEEIDRLMRKIKFPACHLMAGKKLFGAEFIRKHGYDTELADKRYGPDWLDRDDGPPMFPHWEG